MRSYEYIAALNHWSSPSPYAVARPDFLVSVLLVKHFGIMAAAFGENYVVPLETDTYKGILEHRIRKNQLDATGIDVYSH